MIVQYIDSVVGNREEGGPRWGVEPICAQLTGLGEKISSSTYDEHGDRVPTRRETLDAVLRPVVARVHADNYGIYGGRCAARPSARPWPPRGLAPSDLVDRDFSLHAPDRLWVADFT